MIRRILVVTGGHRVAMDDFLDAIAGICSERGWVWAHSTQPSAPHTFHRCRCACR